MRGIEFYTMKREGLCRECSSTIPANKKSVLLGEHMNRFRYCIPCFLKQLECEFNIEFKEKIEWVG